MPRIAGVDIPEEKRVVVALTYIMGIGRSNVYQLLNQAGVDPSVRVKQLTPNQITRLQKAVDTVPTEGEVRKQVRENIQRLKRIGSYRGLRHSQNMPTRGQKTRTNARTKRGKRKTVGALKKKELAKIQSRTESKDEK